LNDEAIGKTGAFCRTIRDDSFQQQHTLIHREDKTTRNESRALWIRKRLKG
jgi:hypothetical protein